MSWSLKWGCLECLLCFLSIFKYMDALVGDGQRMRRKRRSKSLPSAPHCARALAHDFRARPRDFVILTTATWMTSTATKPELHAAAVAVDGHSLTLVVP